MAKTLDQLVQEALGAQTLTILRLQAENELLGERLAQLTPKVPTPADEKPD